MLFIILFPKTLVVSKTFRTFVGSIAIDADILMI